MYITFIHVVCHQLISLYIKSGYSSFPFHLYVDVAESVFNRCTTVTSDSKFSSSCAEFEVTFNCEFLEDFQHEEHAVSKVLSHKSVYSVGSDAQGEKGQTEQEEDERAHKGKKYWSTTWGPTRFMKSNHPLAIMVSFDNNSSISSLVVVGRISYSICGRSRL